MTKREAKAVEIVRGTTLLVLWGIPIRECTDEDILKSDYCQGILKGMDWVVNQIMEAV